MRFLTPTRVRFLPILGLFSFAAFLVGARLVPRGVPPRHPLTGRPIAGIATNAGWMDRAERDGEEQPERALDLIGITPGLVVADIGAGTGNMTIRIARRVGPAGKVFANEIQPALLRIIQDKVHAQGLSNVENVQGMENDARLPDGAIDLALLVDVYHELHHPQAMLRSIRRSLAPHGRLTLIEYRQEDASLPIANEHRMSVRGARTEVEAEGFRFERVVDGLPRQHILVFYRLP